MIKPVPQAIPTYIKGVYRILASINKAISYMLAKFWWGDSESIRNVHWRSWTSMCTSKCLGGLVF